MESRRKYVRRFSMLPDDGDVLSSSAPDLSPSDVGGVVVGVTAGSMTNGATKSAGGWGIRACSVGEIGFCRRRRRRSQKTKSKIQMTITTPPNAPPTMPPRWDEDDDGVAVELGDEPAPKPLVELAPDGAVEELVATAGVPPAGVVFIAGVDVPDVVAVFVPVLDCEELGVDVDDDVDVLLAAVVDVVEVVLVVVEEGTGCDAGLVTGVVVGTSTSRTMLFKVISELPGGVPRGSFSFLIVITCMPACGNDVDHNATFKPQK